MKQLFYLLSFLLCISNHPSNKNCSSGNIKNVLERYNINPEEVREETKMQLYNFQKNKKHTKFEKILDKLMRQQKKRSES